MYCEKCGNKLEDGARFCVKCGVQIEASAKTVISKQPAKKQSDKTVAVLFGAMIVVLLLAAVKYLPEKGAGAEVEETSATDYVQDIPAMETIIEIITQTDTEPKTEEAPAVDMESMFDKVKNSISLGEYTEALNTLEEIKALDSQNENVYLYEADIYLAQDRWEEAVEALNEGMDATGSEVLENRKNDIRDNLRIIKEEMPNFESGTRYEYDANGNQVKAVFYCDGGNEIEGRVTYEYDAKGNLIKAVSTDETGIVLEWGEFKYEYDSNGYLTRKELCNENGLVVVYDEYQYDVNGNVIREINYQEDEYENYITEYNYEYDAAGNQIKSAEYIEDLNSGIRDLRSMVGYEYDTSGKKIKEIYYGSNGTMIGWLEYEYDVNGKETKSIDYNADGSIYGWTECKYDINGNIVKRTEYYSDGSIYSWTEYNSVGLPAKEDLLGEYYEYTYSYVGDNNVL